MSLTSFFELMKEDLAAVEDCMRAQADEYHAELKEALLHLVNAGGKRIRPALTLLSGAMLGGERQQLIMLAAAIELLHTATLVHDDLIDGALLRRGNPTLNSRWSPGATVMTGDFLFARAARLAAQAGSVEAMRLFSETLATIVDGEITQNFASRGVVSRQNYYVRIRAKTASLFKAATTVAALVSPVNGAVHEALSRYGYEVGMAFQIVDDVLDFTGEQVMVGKPVGSDLRQGLITLPALYYFEQHPSEVDLESLLNASASNGSIDRLIEAIRESGAIQQALAEAQEFAEQAIAALASLPLSKEHQALEDVARYIVNRQL